MNWLITGGCGFIGTSLIQYLKSTGDHHIRVVDNLSVGTTADLGTVCDFTTLTPGQNESLSAPDGVELIVDDILDVDAAKRYCAGIDVVVHLAANTGVGPSVDDPLLDCRTNVLGIIHYLDAARLNNVKKFIFASSGAPVGEVEKPPIHENIVARPVSPYGASKLAGEGYCSAYFRSFGLETVALRFGNVYGPGSTHKSSLVAKFCKKLIDQETIEIYGTGDQTRDFIYIQDLIDAIGKSATCKDVGGEIFQIATSQETTVNEITDALMGIAKQAGLSPPEIIHTEKRTGDVLRNFSDTSKASKYLGWQSTTSLNDGLKATLEYFIEHNTSK